MAHLGLAAKPFDFTLHVCLSYKTQLSIGHILGFKFVKHHPGNVVRNVLDTFV